MFNFLCISFNKPPYEINLLRCKPSSKSDKRFKFFSSSSVIKSVSFTGYFVVSSIADCISDLYLFFFRFICTFSFVLFSNFIFFLLYCFLFFLFSLFFFFLYYFFY